MCQRSIVFSAVLLVTVAGQLFGQRRDASLREGRVEVGVALGFASAQEILSTLADLIITVGTIGTVVGEPHDAFGPFSMSADLYVSDLFSYGGELSYFSMQHDYTLTSSDSLLTTIDHFYAAMGRLDLHWATAGPFEFSSGVAVGAGIFSQRETGSENPRSASTVLPAFQVSPLRLRVGADIGAFLDLGFGFRGALTVGVSGRF